MKLKLPKFNAIIILWIVVLVMSAAAIFLAAQNTSPLSQYIVNRNCDFLLMGDFSTAVCTDGTVWTVVPFAP